MRNESRSVWHEFLWLSASLLISIGLLLLITGNTSFLNSWDIHLHDTMFVVDGVLLVALLFLIVNFIVYFFKEFRKGFTRKFPNWILLLTSLLLILAITTINPVFAEIGVGQWNLHETVYNSPTSSTSQTNPLSTILLILQLIVISLLVFATYKWGKNSKTAV